MQHHPIILSTINGRYTHTALGLRWLYANLGDLCEQAAIREFTFRDAPLEIAEELLAEEPRILGFGVYIWNVGLLTRVVQAVKAVRPEVTVVVGGPEASHEYEGTELYARTDYLVRGEGEVAFARLAQAILAGTPPAAKTITGPALDLTGLVSPYEAYTDEDVAHRNLYVEASRGCPFGCEFCLSSLEPRVREFPLDPFLGAMGKLIDRGARRIRFVDRTFNLREARVHAILDFFQQHWCDGMQLHFEIVPACLTETVVAHMAQFPAEGLHLEVGVQTFNRQVLDTITRHQDPEKTEAAIRALRSRTGALLHADLVAGLPGESWESIASGFDRLLALAPQEIQVGILKRLKGAPIARHIPTHGLVFARHPPYEILETGLLDFMQMQRIKRFARYFDLYYNSGNFPRTLDLLWRTRPSAFEAFMAFSDVLWSVAGRTHHLPLVDLAKHLYRFLVQAGVDTPETIAQAVKQDYCRMPGRGEPLDFLGRL